MLTAGERDGLVLRNTLLLMAAQAALLASGAVWFTLAVVEIVDLTGRERWAGVLLALFNASAAAAALTLGRLMDRSGRRPSLVASHVLLGIGGAAGALAVWAGSLPGLLGATAIFAAGQGGALLGRVAVADMYPSERRGRVVGVVVSAGTLGAVGGAPLVALTERLSGSELLPYLMIPAIEVLGVAAVLALRPDPMALAVEASPAAGTSGAGRRLGQLLRLPPIRAAVAAIAVAQTAMVAVMGVAPIAIQDHGGGSLAIAVVIGVHIAGMYALGPALGVGLDRLGRRPGLLAGAVLSATGAVLGSFAHQIALVAVGMTLVGIGWSACFLGATAVISDLTTVEERGGALGATDLLTSVFAAIGALGGGFMLESAGLGVVGVVMAALMVPVVLLVLPLREPSPGEWRWRPPAATMVEEST
ncbi:MAG: MFS transporter [Thermoleophilia bacterium]|nr:MFS transporter [Thermoleophilia bacterium]